MIIENVNRCLFNGDIVSVGGCAQNFKSHMMNKAIDYIMSLPSDTKLFSAHEMAMENLKFCLTVEPNNILAQETLEKYMS